MNFRTKGEGVKNPKFLQTYFMDSPLDRMEFPQAVSARRNLGSLKLFRLAIIRQKLPESADTSLFWQLFFCDFGPFRFSTFFCLTAVLLLQLLVIFLITKSVSRFLRAFWLEV